MRMRDHEYVTDLFLLAARSEEGCRAAAQRFTSQPFRIRFAQFARQRARCTATLALKLLSLGGDPNSLLARSRHHDHIWNGARRAPNDDALLAEAIRSEAIVVSAYERALSSVASHDARTIVRTQYTLLSESLDQLRALAAARTATEP